VKNRNVPTTKQITGMKNKCRNIFLYAEKKQTRGIVIAPTTKRYDEYCVVILTLKTEMLNEYVRLIRAIPKKEI